MFQATVFESYSRIGWLSYVTDGIFGVQTEGITETCFSMKDPQSSGMNGKYFFLDCLILIDEGTSPFKVSKPFKYQRHVTPQQT
jgi:hypothetical protein